MTDIEIEINGQTLKVGAHQTILQAADEAGIYIPRFCYHKHLSIAANCRMCLVEVEKSPKAVPACATPVMAGMKVYTTSEKALRAQRAVMEFLLVNHPLDCPICDQGGECELQDLAMGYGDSHSAYQQAKRSVANQNLGPLIATEMTRCIFCTRCVRFGDEIAGFRELGGLGRGGDSEISTYIQRAIHSEVSGNIIDLCPVGALTSKPYAFTARPWELNLAPSISPHDCVGSNLSVHTRNAKVMRVTPRENKALNQTWISDRDRFSYTGLYHSERLTEPMAKINGTWQPVEWEKALELISTGLRNSIAEHGTDKIGALVSPNASLEECYLLQKLIRSLGSSHIDYRLRAINVEDQAELSCYPGFHGFDLEALASAEAVLLLGSRLHHEQAMVALRLRQAARSGASIVAINPVDYSFHFPLAAQYIIAPHAMARALAAVINAIQPTFAEVPVDPQAEALAQYLQDKKRLYILLGAGVEHHPEAATLRHLARKLAQLTGANIALLSDGANAAGAYLAGAVPHCQPGLEPVHHVGLDAYQMLKKPRRAYLLLNIEPEYDFANAHQAIAAFKQAKFIAALSMYRNPILEQCADVIVPMAAFTETSGTFVNAFNQWQSFAGVAHPYAASRPAWKILRVLANFLHLEGFDYQSSDEVKEELRAIVEKNKAHVLQESMSHDVPTYLNLKESHHGLSRMGDIPLYAGDSLVRHAIPLQETQAIIEGDLGVVRLHPDTAKRYHIMHADQLKLSQQGAECILSAHFDERVARDTLWVAGGMLATAQLGDLIGEITLEKMPMPLSNSEVSLASNNGMQS